MMPKLGSLLKVAILASASAASSRRPRRGRTQHRHLEILQPLLWRPAVGALRRNYGGGYGYRAAATLSGGGHGYRGGNRGGGYGYRGGYRRGYGY